jgi:hypothetical protein
VPFDLTEWGALNNTRGLWDAMVKQNAIIEFRAEPFLTWATDAREAKLSLLEDNVSFEDQVAIFTGKVENNSGYSIDNGVVTAVIRQKSGGKIVAVGSVHLVIVTSAATGQILDYQLVIPLPADVNPASVEAKVTATGQ